MIWGHKTCEHVHVHTPYPYAMHMYVHIYPLPNTAVRSGSRPVKVTVHLPSPPEYVVTIISPGPMMFGVRHISFFELTYSKVSIQLLPQITIARHNRQHVKRGVALSPNAIARYNSLHVMSSFMDPRFSPLMVILVPGRPSFGETPLTTGAFSLIFKNGVRVHQWNYFHCRVNRGENGFKD